MHKTAILIALFLLLPLSLLHAEQTFTSVPAYDLSISFDVPGSRMNGNALFSVEAKKSLVLDVSNLILKRLTMNGKELPLDVIKNELKLTSAVSGTAVIEYEARFQPTVASSLISEKTDGGMNTISDRGIILAGNWYPAIKGPARYRLTALLPAGYHAVSEADRIESSPVNEGLRIRFHFEHALYRITLAASDQYHVVRDKVNGIELYGYFLHKDQNRAKTLLEETKKIMSRYQTLLTDYPYRRFSIVENHAGYEGSRPSYLLMPASGPEQPGVPEHYPGRILEQWFGNSLYVDVEKGNWADGLNSYIADYLVQEQAGRGSWYRKQVLLGYSSSVRDENEIALNEYRAGTDPASRAIGSGKGLMVFHMLRRAIGDDAFFGALKDLLEENRFQKISWHDIRIAFEKKTGRDLAPFFAQWIEQKGLPVITVSETSVKRTGDGFDSTFSVLQKGSNYVLDIPVVLSLMNGTEKRELLSLDREAKQFTLTAGREPRGVIVDNEYEVARKLGSRERPPLISDFDGDERRLIVLPAKNKEAYAPVIKALKAQGAEERENTELKDQEIRSSSLMVLGRDNPVISRVFGLTEVEMPKGGVRLAAKKNPWKQNSVIVILDAETAAEAEAALPLMTRCSSFTGCVFEQGRIAAQHTGDSWEGIRMGLREPVQAIDLSTLKTLNQAIAAAGGAKVVYIGEYHDRFAHHAVQLDVIRSLFEQDRNLAIGMEMFQRPFQSVLDDYISGAIDERTFLKRSEYFKRWVFDYNLYKPILDFAREQKLPVIALNQKKEIVEKVSKDGLDSLSEEERKELPGQMDFSDQAYRERLQAVFEQHRGGPNRKFDFFYQAQVLWDETMALSVDEFLQKNPGHRVVVIAGGGHLAYGSGIPRRVFRRNGLPYFIALNDADMDKDIANYLILPEPLKGTTAPKLMAVLKAENKQVSVVELPDNSPSKTAGIRPGDVILALDEENIESVEDIKLALFYKKPGDRVAVKVDRKRFMRGDKLLVFNVLL